MKRPANCLCPLCGEQGEVEQFGGGRHFVAACLTCPNPSGSGPTEGIAVDRWIRAAERACRLRGAA